MVEKIFLFLNSFAHFLYKTIFKPFAFQLDPEFVHDRITTIGIFIGKSKILRSCVSVVCSYQHPVLSQTIHDITFKNPIGLSAGFDKDGLLLDILPSVGFGFIEVGSITGEPCKGNPKPRLWRMIQEKSLIVYYGLKSRGCEEVSRRLANKKVTVPWGTNIAKTNSAATVDTEKGIADYVKAFRACTALGNYFTINLSCPNAYGGLPFTDPKKVDKLLTVLDTIPTKKPIFLKLSPDLSTKDVDGVIAVAKKHRVHGFICSNLTKRKDVVGGISGKKQEPLSDKQIAHVYKKTKGKYTIIGVGGVFSAKDAYRKIRLGASFIEMITGMVFEGPQIIGRINYDLVQLLKRDGFHTLSDAIGVDNG